MMMLIRFMTLIVHDEKQHSQRFASVQVWRKIGWIFVSKMLSKMVRTVFLLLSWTATASGFFSAARNTLASTTSNELLNLLKSDSYDYQAASRLVDELIASKCKYDPAVCLNDDCLWTVRYSRGPKPRWQIGGQNNKNIQGQQYSIQSQSVVNYAELIGSMVHVKVYADILSDAKGASDKDAFLSKTTKLVQTPNEYPVQVNRGSISVFGATINLPIAGPGCVRVLYADPNLRVFVTPTASEYEELGLVVAQVRSQLLDKPLVVS